MQPGSSQANQAKAKSLGGQEALQTASIQKAESKPESKAELKADKQKETLKADKEESKVAVKTNVISAKSETATKPEAKKSESASEANVSPTKSTAKVDAKSDTKVEATAKVESKSEKGDSKKLDLKANATKSADQAKTESSAEQAKAELNDLEVLEFVLANQVENREPKNLVDSFTSNEERGFAFARLRAQTNSKITFVWYRNGHEYARFTLPVNASKKWRTYSSVKLRPGEWKVQLLAEDKVLAEKTFTLQTAEASEATPVTQGISEKPATSHKLKATSDQ